MSDPEAEATRTRRPGELNDPQQRRLYVTCKYIDGLLSEIEHALHFATSQSPFPRYYVDVTPAQALEIEGRIRRFRSELLQILAWQRLKPEPPEIPVTRSIMTDLSFIDNAIEELKPKYLRGCGAVPEDAVDDLNGAIHKLRSLTKEMESYLRQELSANIEPRLSMGNH
ncbi:MAG: hypothetical protein ABSC48_16160 [Terracidiphilus sp.]